MTTARTAASFNTSHRPDGAEGRAAAKPSKGSRASRHHCDVLEQQDAEHRAAVLGVELSPFGQQLQYQRRGGHGQAEADDQRRLPGFTESEFRRESDDQHGAGHLGQPQAEDRPAQHPQSRRLQFEADHEHQEYDAELGDVQRGVDAADEPEAGRSDDHAGSEIAQNRTELEAAKDGYGDDG
jgi:hypothetical protein